MRLNASIVTAIIAPVVLARPRAMEEGDPLPQKSRVTAFVVNDRGEPSVECWEITNMVNDMQSRATTRADGSKARLYALPLASGRELDGLDILTWPSASPIWPDPEAFNDGVHAEFLDMSNTFNLFNIQGGLINFNFYAARFGMAMADEVETHIFSLENGDDWFYFEDSYTGSELAQSASAPPAPFTISTISSTETEMLRLRFHNQPKHRVVHKGACSFTGIQTPTEGESRQGEASQGHSPLTVQVNIKESL